MGTGQRAGRLTMGWECVQQARNSQTEQKCEQTRQLHRDRRRPVLVSVPLISRPVARYRRGGTTPMWSLVRVSICLCCLSLFVVFCVYLFSRLWLQIFAVCVCVCWKLWRSSFILGLDRFNRVQEVYLVMHLGFHVPAFLAFANTPRGVVCVCKRCCPQVSTCNLITVGFVLGIVQGIQYTIQDTTVHL